MTTAEPAPPQSLDLAELRQAFLQAPESEATRIVAIGLSLTLLAVVLWLVRRRRLREEYTPIWVASTVGMTLLSLRLDVLRALTGALFLVVICLNYAVRLSRYGTRLKELAQDAALLRAEVERLAAAQERTQTS
jgi:prepilin signal peptidase PulO-like enzyme (type II secretory pathway)